MPAPLNVNREAVKTLAIAIGVRQAAREMGLPEKTVLAWSHRHNWFPDANAREERAPIINGTKSVQSHAVKPASDVMTAILADDERETRLSLARYARKCSQSVAANPDLDKAPLVHKVAQTAGIVHKWDQKSGAPNVMVNIALLGIDPGDVEASEG